MKRILSVIFALVMTVSAFALPSIAEENVNYEAAVNYYANAHQHSPTVDAKIKNGEYLARPIHRFSESKEQFCINSDLTDIEIEFDVDYDLEYLYFSWVVTSEHHTAYTERREDGSLQTRYAAVEFIVTADAPKEGETTYGEDNDYFHAVIFAGENGYSEREVLNTANSFDKKGQIINLWDAVCLSYDETGEMVYEARVPWTMIGKTVEKYEISIGVSYRVSFPRSLDEGEDTVAWQGAFGDDISPDRAGTLIFVPDYGCYLPTESLPADSSSESSEELSESESDTDTGGTVDSSITPSESIDSPSAASEPEASPAESTSDTENRAEAQKSAYGIISVAIVLIMALAAINLVRKKRGGIVK